MRHFLQNRNYNLFPMRKMMKFNWLDSSSGSGNKDLDDRSWFLRFIPLSQD